MPFSETTDVHDENYWTEFFNIIKRIMESLYFGKDTPVTVIRQFASDRYGEYGGYAQQYLFYFGKINEIGKKLEAEYGVRHLPSDFKKKEGYKQSIELSKEYNLYRQNFCGCVFSKNGDKENV